MDIELTAHISAWSSPNSRGLPIALFLPPWPPPSVLVSYIHRASWTVKPGDWRERGPLMTHQIRRHNLELMAGGGHASISKQGHSLLVRRTPDQEHVIYDSALLYRGLVNVLFFPPCLGCNEWNGEGVNLVAQRTNCLISSSHGDSKKYPFKQVN